MSVIPFEHVLDSHNAKENGRFLQHHSWCMRVFFSLFFRKCRENPQEDKIKQTTTRPRQIPFKELQELHFFAPK